MSAVSYVKQIYSKQGGSGGEARTAKLCETFRTACVDTEEVELASTDDLFSKYFDADSVDAESRNVVQDSIKADLDFNNKVFEPNYACPLKLAGMHNLVQRLCC